MEEPCEKDNMHLSNSESKKIAMKVSKTTIIINLILFILKLFAGIFAKSGPWFQMLFIQLLMCLALS